MRAFFEIYSLIEWVMKKKIALSDFIDSLNILLGCTSLKLEDLKVLKSSPDLLNNVKISHGQSRLIIQTYFVLPHMGMEANFGQVT